MTLIVFGVILGAAGVLAAVGLREPTAGEALAPTMRRAHAEGVAPVRWAIEPERFTLNPLQQMPGPNT